MTTTKLVPLEPTTEMKQAACTVELKDPDTGYFDLCWEEAIEIYKSMIAAAPVLTEPMQPPDYAYPTIKDYEDIVGFEVSKAFKMGWMMARTTNDLFDQMKKNND